MMRDKGMMMALLGLAAMQAPNHGPDKTRISKAEIERESKIAEEKFKANLSKKGVKEFYIDGHVVYARNYKNAQRKANNLKQMKK